MTPAGSASRQYRRALERGIAKLRDRKPQRTAGWGDRRLNRQKRFAMIHLCRILRGAPADLTEPTLLKLAGLHRVPAAIVREAAEFFGHQVQLA